MIESRTSQSIKNARVSLFFYFIQIILGFFSRKAFFTYLGSEVLGLNTTATNLIGFLNIAELGVSSSVAYFLYKPLFEKDRTTLNKVITVQGWIYRKVACFIIFASFILLLFFPLIFSKSSMPLWYAYSTFIVLLLSALLGYFFNYRQILLTADQKNYVVQSCTQGLIILKVILQIIAITYCVNPFLWWLGLEVVFSIVTCWLLNRVIRQVYPWLETDIKNGKLYNDEFPEILKKTKQIFVHKLSAVILQQCSPLVIYAFTSLTTVAYYGNYILIIGRLSSLVGVVFNSTGAAIGNLIAANDEKKKEQIFWELFDSRLCIVSILLMCAYHLTNPFITIWLGKEYILGDKFLFLYIILQGIMMTRTTVDSFLSAHGLYHDIYAPICEAMLNIILSVLFGFFWGLEGVIMGVLLSMFIVVELWKPYFLFSRGMKKDSLDYFKRVILNLILISSISIILSRIAPLLPFFIVRETSYLNWFIYSIILMITVLVFNLGGFFVFSKGCRDFIYRIYSIWFQHS